MAGLKELRNRIEAVKSTEKITSAMKMVAASRLRRAQNVINPANNYLKALELAASRVLADIRQEETEKKIKFVLPKMMFRKSNVKSSLLLIFSSDKGLCGSYNSNIYRFALSKIRELQEKDISFKIFCFGKKAYRFLKKRYPDSMLGHIDEIAKKGPDLEESRLIAEQITSMYNDGDFDICEAIFAKFNSAVSREMINMQILPIDFDFSGENGGIINKVDNAYYSYEPDRFQFLSNLLPMIFESRVFDIIAQSQASEHGARMSSMDNATKNAKDMTSKLTLRYNTIRQSAITTELIEIISGAEAT